MLFAAIMMLEGAVDCMVVSVVVRERIEWFGEENVLPSPPSRQLVLKAPPAVALVPALECAASELMVSGIVLNVGAADLLSAIGGWWPSPDA